MGNVRETCYDRRPRRRGLQNARTQGHARSPLVTAETLSPEDEGAMAAVVFDSSFGLGGSVAGRSEEGRPQALTVTGGGEEQRTPGQLGSRETWCLPWDLQQLPTPPSSLTPSAFWILQALFEGKALPWTWHECLAKPVPAPPSGGSWVFPGRTPNLLRNCWGA